MVICVCVCVCVCVCLSFVLHYFISFLIHLVQFTYVTASVENIHCYIHVMRARPIVLFEVHALY